MRVGGSCRLSAKICVLEGVSVLATLQTASQLSDSFCIAASADHRLELRGLDQTIACVKSESEPESESALHAQFR